MPPRSRASSEATRKKRRADRAPTHTRAHGEDARTRSNVARTRKPSISIVGAGRLGTALAVALERRGYTIDALVSTTRAHARRASRHLDARPLALSASELDQLPDSPLVVIATPDDRVAEVAARLAAGLPTPKRARVALHVSGALSSDALAPLAARGFAVGSLHPLVAVSDPAANAEDFAGAYFCVEGDAAAGRLARSLVRSLGGRAFSVAARDKALYHASAVFAAGHLVALFDLAAELLSRCGLSRPEARRVLLPLARGTVSNLSHARTDAEALTGPFARADAATVRRHLAALAPLGDEPDGPPDAPAAYSLLGLRSLRLAAARGVDPARLDEIARALVPAAKSRG
jgi:predicted short-subunit dehydrogenase-like oxidoreductase (DUF2520 family)